MRTGEARDIEEALSAAGRLRGGEELVFTGLAGSAPAFFLARLFERTGRTVLAVTADDEAAEEFASDLCFFLGEEPVALFPSSDVVPFEDQAVHPDIEAARLHTLWRLGRGAPLVVVTAAAGVMERVIPAGGLGGLRLAVGDELPLDELAARLAEMGYVAMSLVEERGEMSRRGGIMDVFAPSSSRPVRIEFFGDEIESIRLFDPATQRSEQELEEAVILPARQCDLSGRARYRARMGLMERAQELGLERRTWEETAERLRTGTAAVAASLLPLFFDRLATLFDHLPQEATVARIDSPRVASAVGSFCATVEREAGEAAGAGRFFLPPRSLYLDEKEFSERLSALPRLRLDAIGAGDADLGFRSNLDIRQDLAHGKADEPLRPLSERIGRWLAEGRRVVITAHDAVQAERTVEVLGNYDLRARVEEKWSFEAKAGLSVVLGRLGGGFRVEGPAGGPLAVVAEAEVFGTGKRRPPAPKRRIGALLDQLQDLSAGDAVVHALHGIGLYRGLRRMNVDSVERDFLLIEYRGGDRLYVPVESLSLVSRYHGVEGRSFELDKLGSTAWERRKKKVKGHVEKLAAELLRLYAERRLVRGHAFRGGEKMMLQFEAAFEYDETPDQLRAIEEVLSDMESERPMDRLVCGDVGYGKTEVAMRAAFKAVLDGKQVAVLVPTTVLAQQHYRTFKRRFADWPVTVGVLSRFVSRRDQQELIAGLRRGAPDIVIGTHRLLAKDVEFRDLGLVVIDEEHRFGVAHKERLKQLRREIDVLTLTATPIPRTLHMSLAGMRDISIISTPPRDRLAVKTTIIRFNEHLLREAVERELARGGQVFFVHNRIESIGAMEHFLRRLVPRARVAVAHGRMARKELEERMLGFVDGRYDILLSTSIIESGLDIPSANTIIINRADRFGLAELYQLRGRVGRSRSRAYAYLVCPDLERLGSDARRRMEVMAELSELGAGFRLAAYDLEIRGAGELLGPSQSGQIAEVGFDMYARLLDETVRRMRGEEVSTGPEPEVNLRLSQYLPDDYIPDSHHRLGFYKKLATAEELEEIDRTREELRDRYGDPPEPAEHLFETAKLRVTMKRMGANELVQRGGRLYLGFDHAAVSENAGALIKRVARITASGDGRYRLTPDSKVVRTITPGRSPLEEASLMLKDLSAR
ncbi:MAG TPA: transcription-repair coupling factor [Deltaproteobacteria bacterium]|nr:transcription-repair coupling factor [Deltaproteobacteria bacterium]